MKMGVVSDKHLLTHLHKLIGLTAASVDAYRTANGAFRKSLRRREDQALGRLFRLAAMQREKTVEELEDRLREAGGMPSPDAVAVASVALESDEPMRTSDRCNQSLKVIDCCEKELYEELSEVTSEIESSDCSSLREELQTLLHDVRSNLQMVRRILAKNVTMSAAMAAAS